jgi:hypothetical protein
MNGDHVVGEIGGREGERGTGSDERARVVGLQIEVEKMCVGVNGKILLVAVPGG